jgi:raffinose/stachyose/melibiose transport system permease protein
MAIVQTKWRRTLSLCITYAILIALTVFILSPLVMVLFSSFKTTEEYTLSKSVYIPPHSWAYLDNYKVIFERSNLLIGYRNSLIIVCASTLGSVIMCSMVAFVLTRFEFKGKGLVLGLYLMMNIFPMTVVEVFRFIFMTSIGLFNTLLTGIILYMAAEVLSIYIFIQAMKGLPRSLDESAMLDGASFFRIYRSIIMPLSSSAIVTVIILKVISIYNDFFIPYLYMPGPSVKTATKAIFDAAGDLVAKANQLTAGLILLLLPTLVLYLAMQKWIISGITAGSIKE